MRIKRVAVFCGSSMGSMEIFAEKAQELGQTLAKNGIEMVYGGGSLGLMKITAQAALQGKVKVIGVIPKLLHEKIKPLEGITTIITEDMHERKAKMYELSDAFIALPGGPGTLEELIEVFTWKQLGYHTKPVAILNIAGFYTPLIEQFAKSVQCGFLKKEQWENLIIAENIGELMTKLFAHHHVQLDKWQ